MRYVFLDIDGVLNSRSYIRCNVQDPHEMFGVDWSHIDPGCISVLNKLLVSVGSHTLVLSSDWRKYKRLGYMNRLLSMKGLRYEISSYTPILDGDRYSEISLWLKSNDVSQQNAIVVDDNSWDGFDGFGRFIRTDSTVGLTLADIR